MDTEKICCEEIERLHTENAELRAEVARLTECLKNLHALVLGECPSLLDEDRGGDAKLDEDISAALAGEDHRG